MIRVSLVTVLLSVAIVHSAAADGRAQPGEYGISGLVTALEGGDYGQRVDFARLALDELIGSYEQTLGGSALAAPSLGGKTDLRRWRAATNGFVAQLRDARRRLDGGADVQLSMGADGDVVMFIGRQPVLLSGPDVASTELLRRNVVGHFCSFHSCAAMAGGAPSESQPAFATDDHVPHWSFAQDQRPSFVIGEGVRFVFGNISGRAEKERLSRQLLAELRDLAESLRSAAMSGRVVDWQQVRLLPRRHGSLDQLVINASGDRLNVPAPLLASAPALWRESLPWLHAQVEGEEHALTVWQTDVLLEPNARRSWYEAQR